MIGARTIKERCPSGSYRRKKILRRKEYETHAVGIRESCEEQYQRKVSEELSRKVGEEIAGQHVLW